MRVLRASGIERSAARWAGRSAIEVFARGDLSPASAAEHHDFVKFLLRPDNRGMSGNFIMAPVTREPFAAAFELQRDDVACAVIMRAARLWIDIDAVDLDTVNGARHDTARSRGQISTSTDPTSQHATITTKPVLNEPVR
jgi:hypothetical protein